MKKKLLRFVAASLLALTLGACGAQGGSQGGGGGDGGGEVTTYYNIAFNVNGQRYATARVKEGEKITQTITNPVAQDGFRFVGWFEGNTQVDLATYVVTHNATFEAHFEEIHDEDILPVDDVKEAGHTYYLAFGWWETTATEDDGVTPKHTSFLTPTDVRVIYKNIRSYLTLTGTTEAELENIQFRDYSTATVAEMGEKINADDDVDIVFGVGNNINSTAGVALYNSSNDYKFQSPMGSTSTARYVAATSKATEKGVELYTWLKTTDAGKKALLEELTEDEITASLQPVALNITVTVHGDTDAVTNITAVTDKLTLPTITVPANHSFAGYALTTDGEVVLEKELNAEISYEDIKDLLAEGANTLDLYPIFVENTVAEADLVVYVQLNSGLKDAEARLLTARFNETLTTESVLFNYIEGNADTFTAALGTDTDVVIGGNNPLKNYTARTEGPLANAGAKHFADGSRKVLIKDTCSDEHLTLAKKLYDFVVAEAIEFEVHAAFWPKADHSWVTADEITAITAGLETNLKTFLGVTGDDTLLGKYNVKITTVEISTNTDAGKDKVADLGKATRALREGKGTDLIIGCGNNVDSADGAGMTIVEKKDIPASIVAAGRKVALVHDNVLVRNIYDVLFAEAQQQ